MQRSVRQAWDRRHTMSKDSRESMKIKALGWAVALVIGALGANFGPKAYEKLFEDHTTKAYATEKGWVEPFEKVTGQVNMNTSEISRISNSNQNLWQKVGPMGEDVAALKSMSSRFDKQLDELNDGQKTIQADIKVLIKEVSNVRRNQ